MGCAAAEAPPPKAPAKAQPAKGPVSGPAPVNVAAPGHLARGDVEGVLRRGPPWLLRRVTMEEVIREGRFVGWRLLTLSLPDDWKVDLKTGDVVAKVNGLPLERPDDLWAAWVQLQSAAELRISAERDGRSHDVVLPIDGPSGPSNLPIDNEPPPQTRKPSRWQTIVIESGETPLPPDAQE